MCAQIGIRGCGPLSLTKPVKASKEKNIQFSRSRKRDKCFQRKHSQCHRKVKQQDELGEIEVIPCVFRVQSNEGTD